MSPTTEARLAIEAIRIFWRSISFPLRKTIRRDSKARHSPNWTD